VVAVAAVLTLATSMVGVEVTAVMVVEAAAVVTAVVTETELKWLPKPLKVMNMQGF
jgi:hypothetical protein